MGGGERGGTDTCTIIGAPFVRGGAQLTNTQRNSFAAAFRGAPFPQLCTTELLTASYLLQRFRKGVGPGGGRNPNDFPPAFRGRDYPPPSSRIRIMSTKKALDRPGMAFSPLARFLIFILQ